MSELKSFKEWSLKVKCKENYGGCGSLLQVEIGDINISLIKEIDGSISLGYCFKCPVCDSIVNILENDLPTYVKKTSLKKFKKYFIKKI